jgi:ABC-type multidrug transport system fused ATPase/permease subunit
MHPDMHVFTRSHSSRKDLVEARSGNQKFVDEEMGAAATIRGSDGGDKPCGNGSGPLFVNPLASTSETSDTYASCTGNYISSNHNQVERLRSRSNTSIASHSTTSVLKGEDSQDTEKDKSITATYLKLLSDAWMHSHWPIFMVSFLIFLVLVGAGIAVFLVVAQSEELNRANAMSDLALETGAWFATELDSAILPLFSMAQFATELEVFASLPDQIKAPGEEGALPFMPQQPDNDKVYRNVTGVCDQPELIERFTGIASAIKRNAKMDGVLHNIQLAPQGTYGEGGIKRYQDVSVCTL